MSNPVTSAPVVAPPLPGWKLIESGRDKSVYLRKDGIVVVCFSVTHRKALKVFKAWVKFCRRRRDNPHLPIYGKEVWTRINGDDVLMVEMERLSPIIGNVSGHPSILLLEGMREIYRMKPALKSTSDVAHFYEVAAAVFYPSLPAVVDFRAMGKRAEADQPGLLQTYLDCLRNLPTDARLDTVIDYPMVTNVMQRNTTFVITDPWFAG